MKGQPGSCPEVLAKRETLTEHHLKLKAERCKKRWLLEEGSSNTQTLTRNGLITTLVRQTIWRPDARNDTEVLVNWWRESATGAAAPPKSEARLAHPNLVLRKKQKTQKQAQPLTTMTTTEGCDETGGCCTEGEMEADNLLWQPLKATWKKKNNLACHWNTSKINDILISLSRTFLACIKNKQVVRSLNRLVTW